MPEGPNSGWQAIVGGVRYPIEPGGELTVGRGSAAQVQVADQRVSRLHLSITCGPTGVVLDPLGANPCFLGGRAISRMEVRAGTTIRLADPDTGPEVVIAPAVASAPTPLPIARPSPGAARSAVLPASATPQPRSMPSFDTPGAEPAPRSSRPEFPWPSPSPAGAPTPAPPPVSTPLKAPTPTPAMERDADDAPLDEPTVRRSSLPSTRTAGTPAAPSPAGTRGVVRIGRAADNDLVMRDLLVSHHHAELRPSAAGGWELHDLGSRNGTFVDGRLVSAVRLADGQHVKVGNQAFRFAGGRLVNLADVAGVDDPAIAAQHLSVVVDDGLQLLDDVSFSLPRGGFMAILGTTGAGKSTLLKALTGFQPPSSGKVVYDAQDFYTCFEALRSSLGYVPQDDILHPQLTVRTALNFGAELRFPPEVSVQERQARVEEVIAELGLTERADLPIDRLSGGQRKRTSVALELLTKPSVLYLDEPTSGLDPGYEKSVMETLRTLADGGRAVVVVTHSVASLHLCDLVLILAPGGKVAFCGPPLDALAYFGVSDFADIFHELEHDRTTDWKNRFSAVRDPRSLTPVRERPPAQAVPASPQTWTAQVKTLCRRQVAVLLADRRNLWFLLAEMLVPAVLLLALVGGGALNPDKASAAHDSRILLGALSVAAVAIGAANSLREIVKEIPIYLRERAAGLMRTSYLASKILVVGGITTIQVTALVLISGARAGGPRHAVVLGIPLFELMVDISLAALAAVALGLLLSAIVSSSEKAMSLIAVIFIVEWLFSGVAVDLQKKPVLQPISYTMSANWGMAAAGSTSDLYTIIGTGCDSGSSLPDDEGVPASSASSAAPTPSCDKRWHHRVTTWLTSIVAMLLLTALTLWAAGLALERKEPVKSKVPEPSPWRRLRDAVAAKLNQASGPSGPPPHGGPYA